MAQSTAGCLAPDSSLTRISTIERWRFAQNWAGCRRRCRDHGLRRESACTEFSRAIYRELADEIGEDRTAALKCQPREGAARVRGDDRAPGRRPPLLRPPGSQPVPRRPGALPGRRAAPRLPGDRVPPRTAPTSTCCASRAPATTSAATRSSAARRRARARRASAMPLPHNGYCPSHQHLAETEDCRRRGRLGSRVATPADPTARSPR